MVHVGRGANLLEKQLTSLKRTPGTYISLKQPHYAISSSNISYESTTIIRNEFIIMREKNAHRADPKVNLISYFTGLILVSNWCRCEKWTAQYLASLS